MIKVKISMNSFKVKHKEKIESQESKCNKINISSIEVFISGGQKKIAPV